jgi:molybdenum cofactor cytidylyltransferase
MGQSKQLLEVNGTPLLLNAVRVPLGTGVKSVNIILGANEFAHREIIRDLTAKRHLEPLLEKWDGQFNKSGP